MNETLLNKARLNVVSLNKALINGAVERHGSSAGGGGAPSKYIRFADPAVEAVLMANGVSSDGVGITKEDAAAVTSIGKWFRGNTEITSFDELKYFTGVTDIVSNAFNGCTNLVSIKLGGNVTKLRGSAFGGCSALATITGLDNVTDVEYGIFMNTSMLDSISMPKVKKITDSAFCNSGIKTISIPSAGVVEQNAFNNCKNLVRVESSDKLITLNASAFYGCSNLQFIDISNVSSVAYGAFWGTSLETANMPTGTISESCFRNCTKLTSVSTPNATIIGRDAFNGCTLLSSYTFPSVLQTIQQSAFGNCAFSIVDIPASTTTIGQYAFTSCKSLVTAIIRAITPPAAGAQIFYQTPIASGMGIIYVPDAALEVYKTATNWSQYQDRIHPLSELEGSPYITFADAEVERVLMENNVSSDGVGITMADAEAVTSIGTWFRSNTAITSFDEFKYFTGITKLSTDNRYDKGCFRDCTSLAKLSFPDSLELVENESLRNVPAEMVIDLPNLKSVEGSTFYKSSVTSIVNLGDVTALPYESNYNNIGFASYSVKLRAVELSDKITSIGQYAFYGCTALEKVIIRATTPPSLGNVNAFASTNNCPIYVPDASVDAYKAAANWSTYASRIKPLSEYVES